MENHRSQAARHRIFLLCEPRAMRAEEVFAMSPEMETAVLEPASVKVSSLLDMAYLAVRANPRSN
jgi:hypothetical protein